MRCYDVAPSPTFFNPKNLLKSDIDCAELCASLRRQHSMSTKIGASYLGEPSRSQLLLHYKALRRVDKRCVIHHVGLRGG
jgi:hypothetical protein